MDAHEFLRKELNISGNIVNLVHHLTYSEIHWLITTYARLQGLHSKDLPAPINLQHNSKDKTN